MKLRIRELRDKLHFTQEFVAEYLSCDRSLYSKYETGSRNIPIPVLIRLASLYETSTDFLLGLTDVTAPYPASERKD